MTSDSEGSANIAALGFIAILLLSAGCIDFQRVNSQTDYQPDPGNLVTCSDYPKITDIWKTPDAYYIKTSNFGSPISISEYQYEHWKIGQGIDRNFVSGWKAVNLQPVSENESGFRDACLVVVDP